MEKLIPGFTGFMPKGADVLETLKTYGSYGYRLMEGAAVCYRMGGEPAENAKKIRDLGFDLFAIGTTVQNENYPDVKELVEKARTLGVKNIITYHSSATSWRFADRDELPDEKEIMGELSRMDRLSRELREEGLDFVFHNHDQEFISVYNGVQLYWLIAATCPYVKFELDTCWAQYAGENVPKIIRTLGNRLAALHVKDYVRGENYEYKERRTVQVPRYTTPGSGLVDLQACFQAALEATDVKYAIIEQDMLNKATMDDTVRAAITNLRETGYVE